ncbi:hypothetical protein Tco_0798420 [Tanacetum coccineum]
MEKLVLALVHASRRLLRHFQAHTIVVITDQPIKQILSRPNNAERMLKWTFKLEVFDISYRLRTCIHGQVLADFIMERPEDEGSPTGIQVEEEILESRAIFTDGSSCLEGLVVILILINPEGVEFTYAIRFEFDTSNNEVEYEALKRKQEGECTQQDRIHQLRPPNQASLGRSTKKSIKEKEILAVVEKEGYSWMKSLLEYLTNGSLPAETKKARDIKIKSRQYTEKSCLIMESSSETTHSNTSVINLASNKDLHSSNIPRPMDRKSRKKPKSVKQKSKEKMEKYYNAKVHSTTFKPRDFVYRGNEASYAKEGGKLGPKWESPYEVVEALGRGAYKIRNGKGDVLPQTWNVQDLNKCYL